MHKHKVVYVVADGFSEYNSSHFRATLFCDQLNKHPDWYADIMFIDNWLRNDITCAKKCEDADIIILQRVLIAESLSTALHYKQKGARVYVDFDDAYQLIGEENAAFPFWGEGQINMPSPLPRYALNAVVPDPVQAFQESLGYIDGGITPSELLSNDWSRYGAMYTLPNYLDMARYNHLYSNNKRKKGDDIIVGWGGSMSHLTSFNNSGVISALQKATREKLVKFLLVGDKRVMPLLGINSEDIMFNPYVMWMDWIKVVLRFDIGIAPLAEEYDCRRSRLKVMEYIALGIPFVATKSVVYEDFFHCTSGIFVEQGDLDKCNKPNKDAWYDAIKAIADNYGSWHKEAQISKSEFEPMIAIEQQDLNGFYKQLL